MGRRNELLRGDGLVGSAQTLIVSSGAVISLGNSVSFRRVGRLFDDGVSQVLTLGFSVSRQRVRM